MKPKVPKPRDFGLLSKEERKEAAKELLLQTRQIGHLASLLADAITGKTNLSEREVRSVIEQLEAVITTELLGRLAEIKEIDMGNVDHRKNKDWN